MPVAKGDQQLNGEAQVGHTACKGRCLKELSLAIACITSLRKLDGNFAKAPLKQSSSLLVQTKMKWSSECLMIFSCTLVKALSPLRKVRAY